MVRGEPVKWIRQHLDRRCGVGDGYENRGYQVMRPLGRWVEDGCFERKEVVG